MDSSQPLTKPLHDLRAWTTHFAREPIPVLPDSAEQLEQMRDRQDDVDANSISQVIADDPLMTLKVLAYGAERRSTQVVTDTETVTETLVMMGISPFFRAFGLQETVQQRLCDHPQALVGLYETLERSYRSARFALCIASHRQDRDAFVIQEAALLRDFAEMLLWCHAPVLALKVRQILRDDPLARSNDVHRHVLNIELPDLQHELMMVWQLPSLLIRLSDRKDADHPAVQNVLLSVRLARHTAQGWDNAAVPDDIANIAALLNMSSESTLNMLEQIDLRVD